jgi:hypothetical protein
MTPKEIYSLVVARAKHGALIDRCGLTVYYIALWVAGVSSVLPILSAFFPREYFMVTALGIPFGLGLLAWAIFEWLKWRLL